MFNDIRIFLIFGIILIDIIGIGIIYPILPDLLHEVGVAENANAAFWGGLLSSSYALMQFVFSPAIGSLSDIFGRRPVLLTGLLLLAIDYLIMGLAETMLLLFIGRLIGGIVGGTIATGTAYLADIPDAHSKKKNFAVVGAAFGLGFILGPVIGGVIGEISTRAPFFVSSILVVLNFLLCLFLLPESLSRKSKSNKLFSIKRLNPFLNVVSMFEKKTFQRIVFLLFSNSVCKHCIPSCLEFLGKGSLWLEYGNDWNHSCVLRVSSFYRSSFCNKS